MTRQQLSRCDCLSLQNVIYRNPETDPKRVAKTMFISSHRAPRRPRIPHTTPPTSRPFCAVFLPASVAAYLPYFWNSQSLLSSGQTWRALSHLEMQWKWNACCELVSDSPRFGNDGEDPPHIADSPSNRAFLTSCRSLVCLAFDACCLGTSVQLLQDAAAARWYSHRSMMWFLQMAQLSTTMSQAQSATAFHCPIRQHNTTGEQARPNRHGERTFLTSKRFLPSLASPSAPPFFLVTGAEVGASGMSTSAMVMMWG